jgi:hypothetical protein
MAWPTQRHEQGCDRKLGLRRWPGGCGRLKNVEKPVSARLVGHRTAFIFPLYAQARSPNSNLYAAMRTLQRANHKEIAMSAHLVAGIDFPSQLPTATAPYFLLGLNSRGVWVIRETTGRCAGLFRTREAAIKYAREESFNGNFTILHQPEGLELDSPQVSEAA